MSVCICKMTQITQIHLFLLRVFVSPLPAHIRVFCLHSEAENLADCDFSKQHMFVTGCCEDFVCYHSKNSRTGTAGVEPSWKRRLENVHMKLAETTSSSSSSSSRDFDLFAHKRSTWCEASTSVRWRLFTALNSRPKYDFSLFIEYQVGTEQISLSSLCLRFLWNHFQGVCGFSSIWYMRHSEHDFMHFYFTDSGCQSKVSIFRVSLIVMKQQSPKKVALVPKM